MFGRSLSDNHIERETLDYICSSIEPLNPLQRHRNPSAQHTSAHWGEGSIYCCGERISTITTLRCKEFEITLREFIDPYILRRVNTRNGADMSYIFVLGEVEVVEYSSRCRYRRTHRVDSKALE